MPKASNAEVLQRLGINIQPPVTYNKRAQVASMLDDSMTPNDFSGLVDEPTSLFDRQIDLTDAMKGKGVPMDDQPLFDSEPSGGSGDILDEPLFGGGASQPDPNRSLEFPNANLGADKDISRRDAKFAIDDLLAQQERALAIADEKGFSDKRKSLIRQRFKRAVDQLSGLSEIAPRAEDVVDPNEGALDAGLRRGKRALKTMFVDPIPGAEKVGDMIAGDTREGQRGTGDKALDAAFALTNPIGSMLRDGVKAVGGVYGAATGEGDFLDNLKKLADERSKESFAEKGQALREITGDMVGGLTPVDAITAILTMGESAVASAAVKGGTTGARIAGVMPNAFKVSGGLQAGIGAGQGYVGLDNIVEGVQEGNVGQVGRGVLGAALGAVGVRGGIASASKPFSAAARAQKALAGTESRFSAAGERWGDALDGALAAPENAGITDAMLDSIATDARFGGSANKPLSLDNALAHARSIRESGGVEALEEVVSRPVVPADTDLFAAAIAERQRLRQAAQEAARTGQVGAGPVEDKLLQSMSVARQIHAENEALAKLERSSRFARMERAMAQDPTVEGIAGARGHLAGELPRTDTAMPAIQMSKDEMDQIAGRIMNSDLSVVEKTRVANMLTDLASGSPLPPKASDIDLLEQVLGTKVARAVASAPHSALKEFGLGLINLPRTIMASMDLSGMRQGFVATARHPVKGFKAFFKSLEPAFRAAKYEDVVDDMIADPLYTVAKESGLHFGSVGERSIAGRLVPGEDFGFSNIPRRAAELSEKIPANIAKAIGLPEGASRAVGKVTSAVPRLGSHLVDSSQRHYTLFLDRLRFDIFKDHAEDLLKMGVNPVSDRATFNGFANLINTATGRGPLGAAEKYAKQLGQVFWSPRLLASRVALLNPQYYAQLPEPVRAEAVRTLGSTVAASVGLLTLLDSAPGVKVDWDPRSTDFGKIQIGKTRISLMAGHEGYLQLAAKLLTGQYISQAEKLRKLTGETPDPSRSELLMRFARGKMAPIPNFIIDAMRGRDFTGRKFDAGEALWQMVQPMSASDWAETMKQEGFALPGMEGDSSFTGGWDTSKFTLENIPQAAKNTAKWAPGFFGFNVQTYGERKQSQRAEREERKRAMKEKANADRRKAINSGLKKEGYSPLFDEE